MSAFMVDREHIAYLVTAASRLGLTASTEAKTEIVGQMLWDENRYSIEYRYPDCLKTGNYPGPIGETFVYEKHHASRKPFDPVQVLKACGCYVYQSCEHPGWPASEARKFVERLRVRAIRALPGYDEMQWEITC